MLKKNRFRKTIIRVIEDRYSNWQEKARFIDVLLEQEEFGAEVFIQLIRNHPTAKIRKGAASIVGYLKNITLTEQLIDQIFKEPEWGTRYPLAQAFGKQLGVSAIEKLRMVYNDLIKNSNLKQKHQLKMTFAETLGLMGLKEGIPILKAILEEIGNHRDKYSIELIVQCLYSLGELGDKSIVEFLLLYSAESQYSTETIRNSADHAIKKIATKLNFPSKKTLLEDIYKNQ